MPTPLTNYKSPAFAPLFDYIREDRWGPTSCAEWSERMGKSESTVGRYARDIKRMVAEERRGARASTVAAVPANASVDADPRILELQRQIDELRAVKVPDKPVPTFSRTRDTPDVDVSFFLNDVHIPYHDAGAVSVTLNLIDHLQPSHVFLNGDIIDCYALSRFDKDPNRITGMQTDLDALDDFLGCVRQAAPKAEITYIEGNHENRLARFLMQHPEIFNLRHFKPVEFFGLAKHGILWNAADKPLRHHEFLVTHGTAVRKHSGMSAKAEYERYGVSGISGHTHRAGVYRHRNMHGQFMWAENGCLCTLDPEYVVAPDWCHAVTVGHFVRDTNRFQLEQVSIVDGKLLYDGKLFKG